VSERDADVGPRGMGGPWLYADGHRRVAALCAWSAAWACAERALDARARGDEGLAWLYLMRSSEYQRIMARVSGEGR
jgi:hypothetical protein